MSLIQQIDQSLKEYYNSFEHLKSINDYTDHEDVGKFAIYCSENGIYDGDIHSEIEGGAQDCCLIDFDVDDDDNHLFPFNKPIINQTQQNNEIYRIIKNMYIDAKTPKFQPPKRHYIFSGQKFIYSNDTKNEKQIDNESLLIYGYIRSNEHDLALDDYIGGIPSVIVQIVMFFYGKTYFIFGSAPKVDEYDYAMEILAPIHRIGIVHKRSKVVSLASERSKHNVIYGSNIIQINDVAVGRNSTTEQLDKLLAMAKTITPSYIVFRCKKDHTKKGTHLQYDVSYGDGHEGRKFPYYMFTKENVQCIFDEVFGEFGKIEIMEIYANRSTCNGTWGTYGVSILIFVENEKKLFKSYEGYDFGSLIQERIQNKINDDLMVRFYEKMEGIKANGINCGWGRDKKSLYDLCYLLKETYNGENIFYMAMIDIDRMDLFQIDRRRNGCALNKQGHILHSSFHFPPSLYAQRKILNDYRFYSNTDETLL